MAVRTIAGAALGSICVCTLGCGGVQRLNVSERTGGSAALYGQFRAYDGHTGRPISFAEVVRRCGRADVVLFGEEHSDAVCNQVEAQLLYALAQQARPVTLAMEFFEADTQPDLDAYLTGKIAEPAFRERARQNRAYVLAHRPLIELCRVAHLPVVAANAPRRLIRQYRNADVDYDTFRAGLDPADQRWLPTRSAALEGPYKERFFEMMREHGPGGAPPGPSPPGVPATMPATMPSGRSMKMPASAPTAETQPTSAPASAPATAPVAEAPPAVNVAQFYRSQLLWDDSMAESLANARQRHPNRRVMLVVGVFHVARWGGTALKFRERRPDDRVCTVVYSSTTDGAFTFDEQDRHAGDVVIYGIVPPPEEKKPTAPPGMPTTATRPAFPPEMPATVPATQPSPESAPAETQPLTHVADERRPPPEGIE